MKGEKSSPLDEAIYSYWEHYYAPAVLKTISGSSGDGPTSPVDGIAKSGYPKLVIMVPSVVSEKTIQMYRLPL